MLIVRKETQKKPKKMFNMYIKQKTIICENRLVNIVPENRWFKILGESLTLKTA
jgi:hypothetical protein